MKSAYELAMERLAKNEPSVKITDEQRAELAEIDSKYDAKVAERELVLNQEIAKARASGDYEAFQQVTRQLADDRKRLAAEREDKKESVRNRGK